MAYQAGLPAYLYGVTGVGKTSLIRHFLEKKEYFYVSALNGNEPVAVDSYECG